MLANTPCPINDSRTGKLLMGKNAVNKYRENPEVFVVGYNLDKEFWDALLRVGEKYEEEVIAEDTSPKLSISDRFRTSKIRRAGSKSTTNSARTNNNGTGDSGSKPNPDRTGKD